MQDLLGKVVVQRLEQGVERVIDVFAEALVHCAALALAKTVGLCGV